MANDEHATELLLITNRDDETYLVPKQDLEQYRATDEQIQQLERDLGDPDAEVEGFSYLLYPYSSYSTSSSTTSSTSTSSSPSTSSLNTFSLYSYSTLSLSYNLSTTTYTLL